MRRNGEGGLVEGGEMADTEKEALMEGHKG